MDTPRKKGDKQSAADMGALFDEFQKKLGLPDRYTLADFKNALKLSGLEDDFNKKHGSLIKLGPPLGTPATIQKLYERQVQAALTPIIKDLLQEYTPPPNSPAPVQVSLPKNDTQENIICIPDDQWQSKRGSVIADKMRKAGYSDPVIAYVLYHWVRPKISKTKIGYFLHCPKGSDGNWGLSQWACIKRCNALLKEADTLNIKKKLNDKTTTTYFQTAM